MIRKGYFEEGNKSYKMKLYDEAIELYEKALTENIESNYDKGNIYYNMGTSYLGLKEYKKSIEFFNKALEYGYKTSSVYFNIGYSYAVLMNFKKAYIYMNIAWTLNNNDEDCNKGLKLIEKSMQNNLQNIDIKSIKKESLNKEIEKVYVSYYKENLGFEIFEYTYYSDKSYLEKFVELVECKRKDTKKYNKIIQQIDKKYNIKQFVVK